MNVSRDALRNRSRLQSRSCPAVLMPRLFHPAKHTDARTVYFQNRELGQLSNQKRFCPSYHGNATAVFDDNNQVVSFQPNSTTGLRRSSGSQQQNQRLRKNLSNCDLHDDENRSESEEETGDNSTGSNTCNPWSNKLHNEDFNITKKCGESIYNQCYTVLKQIQ